MTSVSGTQLTLSLEPSLPERWETLREYLAHRIHVQSKLREVDREPAWATSPSRLSRKLWPGAGELAQRSTSMTWRPACASTGDVAAVIQYLATKYMDGFDGARWARCMATVEALVPELQRALSVVKAGAAP
jgi:hypothetical protein